MKRIIARHALLVLIFAWGAISVFLLAGDTDATEPVAVFVALKLAGAASLAACVACCRLAGRKRWLPDTPEDEEMETNQREEDYYD